MVARQRAPRAHQVDNARQPLRRSARIIQKSPFRFEELPPEIRNLIYSSLLSNSPSKYPSVFATWEERRHVYRGRHNETRETLDIEFKWPLILSGTAKALSQVSRAIRHESMGIYFVDYVVDFRPSARTSST